MYRRLPSRQNGGVVTPLFHGNHDHVESALVGVQVDCLNSPFLNLMFG
jgi:hypothetical protein